MAVGVSMMVVVVAAVVVAVVATSWVAASSSSAPCDCCCCSCACSGDCSWVCWCAASQPSCCSSLLLLLRLLLLLLSASALLAAVHSVDCTAAKSSWSVQARNRLTSADEAVEKYRFRSACSCTACSLLGSTLLHRSSLPIAPEAQRAKNVKQCCFPPEMNFVFGHDVMHMNTHLHSLTPFTPSLTPSPTPFTPSLTPLLTDTTPSPTHSFHPLTYTRSYTLWMGGWTTTQKQMKWKQKQPSQSGTKKEKKKRERKNARMQSRNRINSATEKTTGARRSGKQTNQKGVCVCMCV